MISIRGNKKVALLEERCKDLMPEKHSRTSLLKRAVEEATEGNADWDRAYALLAGLRPFEYKHVSVPDFFQARLDEETERHYDDLQEDIRESRNLDRVRNDFTWQLLLANLILQEERRKDGAFPAIEPSSQENPRIASQVDGIRLIGTLTRLLETEEPQDEDYIALGKVAKILGDWDADRKVRQPH